MCGIAEGAVEGGRDVRAAVPHADAQPAASQRGQPQGGGAGGVEIGVGDEFGGQQLHHVEHFGHSVTAEGGSHGHTCDACGAGVMRQAKGVHPGIGRGYGDGVHERLREGRGLGSGTGDHRKTDG
jgi:hypothetical protein